MHEQRNRGHKEARGASEANFHFHLTEGTRKREGIDGPEEGDLNAEECTPSAGEGAGEGWKCL